VFGWLIDGVIIGRKHCIETTASARANRDEQGEGSRSSRMEFVAVSASCAGIGGFDCSAGGAGSSVEVAVKPGALVSSEVVSTSRLSIDR
jgi:hypothetical protein